MPSPSSRFSRQGGGFQFGCRSQKPPPFPLQSTQRQERGTLLIPLFLIRVFDSFPCGFREWGFVVGGDNCLVVGYRLIPFLQQVVHFARLEIRFLGDFGIGLEICKPFR